MRISMIGPFGLQPKGTMSVRAVPLARALVQRGHAVRVIVPPWDHVEDAGRRMQDAGVEIENIELPRALPGLFHLNTTRALVKRALDFKPDVIHCFKPKAYAGLSAWTLWQMKRLGRVKARLIIDTDDWEGAGGWNDMEEQGSGIGDQGSGIGQRYSWPQRKMFAWQEQWGLMHNDGVTVASRALESIVWTLGVRSSRVVYVPNGCNAITGSLPKSATPALHAARQRGASVSHQQLTILLYTRFFEFKTERVIEVLRRVVEQVPDAKLLVVGKGFFGEEERLLKQAEAIGLRPAMNLRGSIEYAGWTPPELLPEMFARSSVAIFPFDDTLINRTKCSVKLIDLLAAGVPVIADAVGQNSEYIRHAETGVLVPSGDAAAMAQAVIDLWRAPERRAALSAAAMHDVRERFDWAHLCERVEQLYTVG